jgi:hypothetical protein
MELALYILAAALFVFAVAIPGPVIEPYRLRIVAAGLFCWVLVAVLTAAGAF